MQSESTANFGAKSTAQQVIAGIDLSGKLAVVTGASSGIGKETARVLADAGADVFLASRNRNSLDAIRDELEQPCGGNIFAYPLDLMSPTSIGEFAETVTALNRPLDILINNAGIMASPLMLSEQGLEAQLMTNYLGHALLTSLLSPLLIKAAPSRLVTLTSSGHQICSVDFDDPNFERRPYDKWLAYGQSKTACSLLAVTAHHHLAERGVTSLAVHPGVISDTGLSTFLTEEDFENIARLLGDQAPAADSYKSIAAGAATSVWAATSPALIDKGGSYLEDCGIAPVIEQPNHQFGVMAYALDPEAADRLWQLGEQLLGRALPL